MKVLFACGGTGGHINPALAIAGEFVSRMPETEILFVGADRTMEKKLVPAAGYRLENIHMTGFSRSVSLSGLRDNLKMLQYLVRAENRAAKLIKDFAPDLVIGTGGYICYPVLKAAAARKIPTAIHESNAIPGLTTKLLQHSVSRIMVAFPGLEKHYAVPGKVVVTGTPVRSDFAELTHSQAKTALGLETEPVVVSVWGSLGASKMNEYMADFIAENARTGAFHHIHATGGGEAGRNRMLEMLRRRGIETLPENIDLRDYIYDMGTVMNAADLILCRAGASTIAELTALGKASVIVPSPNVTNHHQEKNAAAVEEAGGAVVVPEAECSGRVLYDKVSELIRDQSRLDEMGWNAAKLGVKNSAAGIVNLLLPLVKKSR